MNGTLRNPLLSGLAFVGLTALFFWLLHTPSPSKDTDLYLGQWTDPHGEPGNRIHFWYKKVDLPNNPVPLLSAYEGHATIRKHLGQEDITVIHNFESLDPLRLNITVADRCNFAAIRMMDRDRMLIRFTKTIGEAAAEDVFDGPEVKALVRVREPKETAPAD